MKQYQSTPITGGSAPARPAKKGPLRKQLARRLEPLLGRRIPKRSNGQLWYFESQIGLWTLETEIDTGGWRDVSYEQKIHGPGSLCLQNRISVLRWMGLSGETNWYSLSEEECEATVETIALLVQLFLASASALLERLSYPL